MATTKPSIGTIDCKGPDGNIYAILAKATKALSAIKKRTLADEMRARVIQSKSYESAKAIIAEYVEVEYLD